MKGFMNFLEDKFVPIAAKIGSQKHLVAIRDGFAATLPLVLAGALAVLLNNVFFVPWSLIANWVGAESDYMVWAFENVAPLFNLIDAGTFSILALALTFSIAYNRAVGEGKDPLSTGLIAVGSFILLGALSRPEPVGATWVGNFLAAQGIFVGLLVALIASEIFFFVVNKKWVIKMPEQVPPAVARAFSAVVPGFFTIFFFGIVAYLFQRYASMTVFTWFEINISSLLLGLGKSIWAILTISFMIPVFWFFGLHGANMLEPVMGPIYGVMHQENIQLFQQGMTTLNDGLYAWTRGSWDAYVFLGGSGATLPLIAAFLLFSKVKHHKEVSKLAAPAGIFMINEPVLFGIPIVLNPVFIIPFIVVQPVLTLVAWLATKAGIAGPIVNTVPWTTPPLLNAYLATNGSLGAVLVTIVNLVIAFLIYLPFVIIANNMEAKKEG